MLNLNKVMLIGNLTRDPELSCIGSGTTLAKMGMAINNRYKDKSGEWREDATFVDVEAWGKTAEFCSKYLAKGRRVYVEGRLRFSQWEASDGSKRSKLSVTADRVEFADAKPSGDGSSGPAPSREEQPARSPESFPESPGAGATDDGTEDDLPF